MFWGIPVVFTIVLVFISWKKRFQNRFLPGLLVGIIGIVFFFAPQLLSRALGLAFEQVMNGIYLGICF
ncbi:hypothetical protein MUG87_19390 [Ectobacillus sp. JY-23]|uniref:hypothetical protein n=1 Tax=Ectobacillus sp. JY-23 TaxID=2933872 RepID=UPI001FF67A2E|nr:hypothetical protein [Ectobacillus sp. JY-23]UOY92546.1 hypothetical protein MUG87_19390 [Ectobacillus sp. JY-23]